MGAALQNFNYKRDMLEFLQEMKKVVVEMRDIQRYEVMMEVIEGKITVKEAYTDPHKDWTRQMCRV